MSYPIVDISDDEGNPIPHYRVEVGEAAVLLIKKSSADADPTLIDREIESLLRPRDA